MRKICLVVGLLLTVTASGCSNSYSSKIQLKDKMNSELQKHIGVAGVLDRRAVNGGKTVISGASTKLLVEEVKFPDLSGQLKTDELSMLMAPPLELSIASEQIRDIGKRLGRRYVIIGEQGSYPATVRSFWNMAFVVPAGPVILGFSIPVQTGENEGVMQATRILRVIDLDNAKIISESFSILHNNLNDEFSSGEISDGLDSMKLAKE